MSKKVDETPKTPESVLRVSRKNVAMSFEELREKFKQYESDRLLPEEKTKLENEIKEKLSPKSGSIIQLVGVQNNNTRNQMINIDKHSLATIFESLGAMVRGDADDELLEKFLQIILKLVN